MEIVIYALKFNVVCIFFYLIAFLLGKKNKAPWVFFGIGAFLEVLGIAGGYMLDEYSNTNITASAILFVILTVLVIWLIRKRKA